VKRVRKQSDDDDADADDDDDPVDDDNDDDDDDTVGGTNKKKKAYSNSEYKERYTRNITRSLGRKYTSIDFDCHLFQRFEYIYEDLPREGIIVVNKPHSTDVWLPTGPPFVHPSAFAPGDGFIFGKS